MHVQKQLKFQMDLPPDVPVAFGSLLHQKINEGVAVNLFERDQSSQSQKSWGPMDCQIAKLRDNLFAIYSFLARNICEQSTSQDKIVIEQILMFCYPGFNCLQNVYSPIRSGVYYASLTQL